MKVLINRAVVNAPWGGGNNFVRAFRDLMPVQGHQVVESLAQEPDIVLLVGVNADVMGIDAWHVFEHRRRHPGCRVIMRLNDCDARKGTSGVDQRMWGVARNCDGLVFVSRWLQEHLLERWLEIEFGSRFAMQFTRGSDKVEHFIASAHAIHNGVDKGLFRPVASPAERRWLDVVTHHWSDNPMKGRDVYEAVARSPGPSRFTYIGRHQCDFAPRTRVVPPLFGEELARELAGHDVYVTGTRWDPGPNHCLEALACGLPVLAHKDGGGAVEFAGQDHTFSDLNDLHKALWDARGRTPNTYVPMSWEECIARYVAVIEEVCSRA